MIYGNHAIRAAVCAMQTVFQKIRLDGGIMNVDMSLPAVKDVIALPGDEQMRNLEARLLRKDAFA